MLAKQRNSKLSPQRLSVLIIHTKYAETGGECSVVKNELALLKEQGCKTRELYFDNLRWKPLNVAMMPFNLVSFFRVLMVCIKFRPDVVHIHNTHFAASHAIIYAIKLLKIPVVKTLHNYRLLCPSALLFHKGKLYLPSLGRSFPWQAIKDKVYRNSFILTFWLSFSNWLHRKAGTWTLVNKYIVLGEQAKQLVMDSNLGVKQRQLVIKPNFTQKNVQSTADRGDHFLYVGRLSAEKGIDVLLKAFSTNGLSLVIIGDGPYSEAVISAMKQNPLIKWKGYQKKEVIEQELKKCTALIFPSICYEGMPLVIIEAFASHTPVIASRLGAMQKMVNPYQTGLLFETGEAESLNTQLITWNNIGKTDKEKLRRKAYRTYTDKYTPERNIEMLLAVYQSVLSERSVVSLRNYKFKKTRNRKQLTV